MTETTRALRSKQSGNNHAPQATKFTPRRSVGRWWMLGLLCAVLVGGVPSTAKAEPAGSPTVNKIFYNCTFTTEGLNAALTGVSTTHRTLFATDQIEASYIIIYVRQNTNDGQQLDGASPTFTGPVLCTNIENTDITVTTEGTAITGPLNVLGAEEVSHLQVQPSTSTNLDDRDKRVCHTVASSTECFLIEFKPSLD